MANPKEFGPHVWYIVHTLSACWPDEPTYAEKEQMKLFLKGFPVMLPCSTCKNSTQEWMMQNTSSLDNVVKNKTSLFTYFYNMHNFVNQKLNKRLYRYEEAVKKYSFKK